MKARPPEIFLHPGEFHFGAAPARIGTLLGSCVSITLWQPRHRVGGMCHILLPCRQRSAIMALDGRYADEAVELFVHELRRHRIAPVSCQVKLFGGGNMFASPGPAGSQVGRRNIDAARQVLAHHGFTVLAEHVGGTSHRRLFFDLASGHVWLAIPEQPDGRPGVPG